MNPMLVPAPGVLWAFNPPAQGSGGLLSVCGGCSAPSAGSAGFGAAISSRFGGSEMCRAVCPQHQHQGLWSPLLGRGSIGPSVQHSWGTAGCRVSSSWEGAER